MKQLSFLLLSILLFACSKEEAADVIYTTTFEGVVDHNVTHWHDADPPIVLIDTSFFHSIQTTRINDSIEIWNGVHNNSGVYFYPTSSIGSQFQSYDERLGGYVQFRIYDLDSFSYEYRRSESYMADNYDLINYSFKGLGSN